MSQELTLTITTKDGSSQTFTKIGTASRGMGTAIQSSANTGSAALGKIDSASTKAASSLDKVDDAARKSASGFADLEGKATRAGAALGTAVGVLSRLGAQAETQRRQIDGIQRAYGDAADQILDFADAIQASTRFSNEDAREAAQIAATLAQNYGFTTEEIEKLISVSADLAAIKGVSLSDAVQRTSAAMRGEAESAEFLGLTLNQQAIDRNNVTLAMSNEEAAHFRLNALLEQSAYAEGAAGDAAQTAAGQAAQAANQFQDFTTSIGSALEPITGVTAGLANVALVLPVAGAAAGKMAAGLSNSTKAMAALSIATGPVGITLGLLAAGAALVINAWQDNQAANQALADSYDGLTAAIQETQTAQQQIASNDIRFDFGVDEQIKAYIDLGVGIVAAGEKFESYILRAEEQARANDLLAQSFRAVSDEGTDELIGAMNRLETETESFKTTGDDAIAMLTDLTAVLQYNGDGAEFLDGVLTDLNLAYAEGRITGRQYAEALDYIANNTADYIAANRDATEATKELTKAQQDAARFAVEEGLRGQSERYEALARSIEKANEAALAPSLASGAGFGLMSEREAEQFQAMLDEHAAGVDAFNQQEEERLQAMVETANALRGQLVPAIEGASSGFAELARPGEDVLDVLDRINPTVRNVGGSFVSLVDGLNDAAQGMDGVLSTFSALDTLGGRSSQAASVAEDLVGDPGVWSTIDDLVSNATITVDEYNAAVQAGYGIQAKDAEIQETLNGIRAQQLPLLDQQTAEYRAYIDRLAEASTAEQQQALYLQDTANQAKLAASYSTAYAASLGEIPEDVATAIIADGAQADPILGDILEKYGLIEVGADGEVRVNFPDAATLDDVTAAIDNLTETQIEIFIAMSGGEIAEDTATSLQDNLDEIDGRQATADVSVDESGADVADTKAALDEIDGTTATATVDVEIEQADASAADVEDQTATITVEAVDNASATIQQVSQAVDALDTTAKSIDLTATDNASSVISRVMAAASALQTVAGDVELNATDNASSTIARVMQAANALSTVAGSVELSAEDQASGVIGRAMQAGNSFDSQTYTANLDADDGASADIRFAGDNGTRFANTTFAADLAVVDGASQPIGQAQLAGFDFATTYTATLSATDNATGTIQGVVNNAREVALEYIATLSASDNASGTISSVAGALAALDGTVATVYVDAVQRGQLPARQLGGAVLPGAQLGRAVMVGEAGPEIAVLPFGAMVQPRDASRSRMQAEKNALLPQIDMADAYRKGGDSAKAFYQGLFDEARSRVRDAATEIGGTRFGSEQEAKAALAEYARLERDADRIKGKIDRAKAYDKRHKAETLAETEALADDSVATMSEAGAEAGAAFSGEMASAIDVGSAMQQIRQLKDAFVTEMKASAGSLDSALSAVSSFNEEVDGIVSGLRGAARTTDRATESMGDDLGSLAEEGEKTGEIVGDELGSGIADGADKASDALGGVSQALGEISGSTVNPTVGLDNKKASTEIKDTSAAIDELNSKSATINVRVNDAAWQRFLDDVDSAQLGVVVTVKTKEKSASEKQLGGGIHAESLYERVPRAANGRVITVGEAGEEAVVLPYGSMVQPHDASRSRLRAEAGSGAFQNFGTVIFQLPTPDLYGAVASQFASMQRD